MAITQERKFLAPGYGFVPDGLVEYTLQVALRQCRAFQVLMCADLAGCSQGLLVGNRFHLSRAEGFGGGGVIPQVELGSDQDDRDVGRVVLDFWVPLYDELVSGSLIYFCFSRLL